MFLQRDAEEWERTLQEEFGAAVVSSMTSAEWLEDQHARDSGTVTEVDDPYLGATRQAGAVLRYAGQAPGVRFPRRLVGSDTEAVKDELAAARANPTDRASVTPSPRVLPLEGIRVLDLTNLLAGPISGRVLAEYGADVIKINKAALGFADCDPLTDDAIAFVGHRTTAAGKRSMYLDLKSEAGQQILEDLVRSADVVTINTPTDKTDQLRIDEARLRELNPNIVYASTRLHAAGGWRGTYRGHEDLAENVTGMGLRYGGGMPDEMHAIVVNDHGTGHFAAFGILLALLERFRTGTGTRVENSLSQTATYFQIPYMISYDGATWDEPQGHDAKGWSPSNRLYEAQDGWMWVYSSDDLATLLDKDGLAGDADSLEATFRGRPTAEWESLLAARGAVTHPYLPIAEAMEDQTAIARGLSVTRDHPGLGTAREVGQIHRFASRPDMTLTPATMPGWHTQEILDELGRGDELASLLEQRVVATAESYPRAAG